MHFGFGGALVLDKPNWYTKPTAMVEEMFSHGERQKSHNQAGVRCEVHLLVWCGKKSPNMQKPTILSTFESTGVVICTRDSSECLLNLYWRHGIRECEQAHAAAISLRGRGSHKITWQRFHIYKFKLLTQSRNSFQTRDSSVVGSRFRLTLDMST